MQDRDALGFPILEDLAELFGSTVDGKTDFAGSGDVGWEVLELASPQGEVDPRAEIDGDVSGGSNEGLMWRRSP